MELNERIAYLKGLLEGLGITSETKEGKVIEAIVDILDDMALSISDMEDGLDLIAEQVDAIDDDVEDLVETVYGDEDEDDEDDFDEELYEVTCPKCGDEICVTEAMLDEGEIDCPGCGETLEFDFSGAIDDCECGCGCHDHEHDVE